MALCSAALKNPRLLLEGADVFGSQCIVISIDAKRIRDSWSCFIKGGREDTHRDVLEWAVSATESGIGEILLNSIDRDGTQAGYDLELIKKVSDLVNVPVIASGGAGTLDQISDAVHRGGADAVLLASLLHYKVFTIADIKKHLFEKGVIVR